ncbi:hypothetical protein DFP72DRAFT_799269, partial [Ephemerocybe angulata]
RAIRMNILINPTGKEGRWRAIDWLVEHNNLYIKRIYSGKYSNHTKDRMIAQSPLIEIFKHVRIQFEEMFCLEHKTSRHSPPKMQKTFAILLRYMTENKGTEFVAKRTTKYIIPDPMAKGLESVQMGKLGSGGEQQNEDEQDKEVEVEDDGSLDV